MDPASGITALDALLFLVAPTTTAAGALLMGERITPVALAGFVLCGAGMAAVLVTEGRRPARDGAAAVDHPSPGAHRREPASRAA